MSNKTKRKRKTRMGYKKMSALMQVWDDVIRKQLDKNAFEMFSNSFVTQSPESTSQNRWVRKKRV